MSEQRFVSYAQNLEDVMLWRALRGVVPEGGFYVDVGASDPTLLSVTRAFYERGWRGVNIEPLPEVAAALREARPGDVVVQAAAGRASGTCVFHRVWMHQQTGLSTLDGAEAERHRLAGAEVETIETPVVTLAALFREHVTGPVHFLKIDAEGAEAEVLAGADFSVVRPWIVLVEATAALTEVHSVGWEPGLLAAGYAFVWFDGLNRFYLAAEHAELGVHFRVQPNVFDFYVVYDPVLHPQVAELEALAQLRLGAIEALTAERDRGLRVEEPEKAVGVVVAVAPALVTPAAGTGLRSFGRRVALSLYKLVRPVVRPIAWRLRQFMVGDLRREMHEISQRQDQLLTRSGMGGGEPDAVFASTMERLLLTLALEEGRENRRAPLGGAAGLSNAGTDG